MPDAAPARLPPAKALDEALAALFRALSAQPAPAALIALADQLDAVGQTEAAVEERVFWS